MPKLIRRLLVALSLCAMLGITGSAFAVENIRNESWRVPSAIGPHETLAGVQFDADLSPLDRLYGIDFSIEMLSQRGSQTLLNYRLSADQLPAAGTRLQISASFLLTCDLPGRLDASKGDLRVSVPGRNAPEMVRFFSDTGSRTGVVMATRGGLALGDEYSRLGPHPMSLDGLVCTTTLNDLPTPGDNGSIGVYFDAAGTQCQGTIHPGAPGMVYILAKPTGATAEGVSGVEFKFTGLPRSWRVFPVANPELLMLGDPFGAGVVAGLPCQAPQGGVVLLYSVLVLADAEESDVEFSIDMRDPPLNREFKCPLLLGCDSFFTKYCVSSQSCTINASRTAGRPCAKNPTSVSQKTWTGVKELYR